MGGYGSPCALTLLSADGGVLISAKPSSVLVDGVIHPAANGMNLGAIQWRDGGREGGRERSDIGVRLEFRVCQSKIRDAVRDSIHHVGYGPSSLISYLLFAILRKRLAELRC